MYVTVVLIIEIQMWIVVTQRWSAYTVEPVYSGHP